jgi:hypothetical protein
MKTSYATLILFLLASKLAATESLNYNYFLQVNLGSNSLASIISSHYDPINSKSSDQQNNSKTKNERVEKPRITDKNDELFLEFGLNKIYENFPYGASISYGEGNSKIYYPNGTKLIPHATFLTSSSSSLSAKVFKDFEPTAWMNFRIGLGYISASTRQELTFGNVLIFDDFNVSQDFLFGKVELIPPMIKQARIFVEITNLGGMAPNAGITYRLVTK